MRTKVFLGKPPANIEQWIIDHQGPEPSPTAPDGKVLYKTAAGGEWLQDDADINNGIFNGFTEKGSAIEVIIPSKDASGNVDITSIGDSAFQGCSGLTSVTIPDSVTSIGSEAFANCRGLTSITIGNSVTSIWSGAFYRCSGLTSVTISNSVMRIGETAFEDCSELTSVTIGSNVSEIGADAFYNCTSVNDVYCYPNPANLTWNENAKDDFKSDGSTCCHVKAEYLTAYQAKFGSIVNVTFIGDLA